MRPHWRDLAEVDDGHLLLRLVRAADVDTSQPRGQRVQLSACRTNDYEPNEKSYGASVYVNERLMSGMDDLYNANPPWRSYLDVRLPVRDVRQLGLHVKYSPMDCPFPLLAHAHASLIGMTRPIRATFIALIDAHLP